MTRDDNDALFAMLAPAFFPALSCHHRWTRCRACDQRRRSSRRHSGVALPALGRIRQWRSRCCTSQHHHPPPSPSPFPSPKPRPCRRHSPHGNKCTPPPRPPRDISTPSPPTCPGNPRRSRGATSLSLPSSARKRQRGLAPSSFDSQCTCT